VPGQDAAKSWVVFSDLHVSTKTLQSALDVLRRVHEEARSRQAGVLFLGEAGGGLFPGVWVGMRCV
jgi:hypothetical protein